MAATDEKISQCVDYYRALLDARPAAPESLRQAQRSGLQSIIKRAGAKRRSEPLLAQLDEAFADAGIVTLPRLTDPANRPDERIYMFDHERQIDHLPVPRQSFRTEDSLWEFIENNLPEFDALRGLSNFVPQNTFDSGRRVDVLCRRPRLNQLVGIELKLADLDDRAVGQCLQYVDDLAKKADAQGHSPRLIVISGGQPNGQARERIRSYARSRGVETTFLLYRVHLELNEYH